MLSFPRNVQDILRGGAREGPESPEAVGHDGWWTDCSCCVVVVEHFGLRFWERREEEGWEHKEFAFFGFFLVLKPIAPQVVLKLIILILLFFWSIFHSHIVSFLDTKCGALYLPWHTDHLPRWLDGICCPQVHKVKQSCLQTWAWTDKTISFV